MKKGIFTVALVSSFVLYVYFYQQALAPVDANPKVAVTPTPTTQNPIPTPKPVPTPVPTPTPVPVPTPKPKGQYTDGTFTGSVADAYYGLVQVQVTISGGKITDVVFLDHPQDNNRSISINNQAMPWLKQEAIAAQSAVVDTISGASETSRAFRESLGAALVKAKL